MIIAVISDSLRWHCWSVYVKISGLLLYGVWNF